MRVERHPNTGGPLLLVADAGVQSALPSSADTIADWIDWMEVVEALCPERVEREAVGQEWVYRMLRGVLRERT